MKSLNTPKGTKKIGLETPLKSPRKESIPRPSALKTKAAHVSELLEEMRTDLSPILPQQFNNFPLDESMLCSKISADPSGNLEHTGFNFLSDENLNNLISASPGGPYRRLLEEYSLLKKELELKSGLVERVMKENKNLRRELEEFLSTVEEARSHIDVELKECSNRIIELEAEIQDLRNENKLYKEQIQSLADTSNDNGKTKAVVEVLEEEVDGYYESSRKDFENFYFKLNEQIVEFMDSSKKQYQDFQKNLHEKMTEVASSTTPVTTKNIPAPISISAYRNSSLRKDPDVASPARSVKAGSNNNSNKFINSRTTAAPTKSRLSSVDSKTGPKMPTSTSATTINKKILSKQNANQSSTDLHHQGLSYNSSKRKLTLTNSSIGLLETESGNLSGFTVPDSKGNPLVSSTVSPKSTILNAKMRSDALLQEMKRKLAEVTGSHA